MSKANLAYARIVYKSFPRSCRHLLRLIASHQIRPRRHLLSASEYRQELRKRFESWAEITGAERAA